MKKLIAAAVLSGLSAPAFAVSYVDAGLGSRIDSYNDGGYIDEEVESFGFDLRAALDLTPNLFARVAYSNVSSDNTSVDIDAQLIRGGLGFQFGRKVQFFGVAEYLNNKQDDYVYGGGPFVEKESRTDSGFITALGLCDNGQGGFLWNLELGYLRYSGENGATFSFDLGWRFTPNFAIVWGGTGYGFKDDSGTDQNLGIGRLGIRLQFGAPAQSAASLPAHPVGPASPQSAAAASAPASGPALYGAPPPAPAGRTLIVGTALKGAARQSAITMSMIPAGTSLQTQARMDNDEGRWWYVQHNNQSGWIPDSALSR